MTCGTPSREPAQMPSGSFPGRLRPPPGQTPAGQQALRATKSFLSRSLGFEPLGIS